MGGDDQAIGTAEAASALRWWLEAGVDALVQEEPRDWLKPAAPRHKASEESPAVAASNITAPTPETLAELQQWLASSTQLPLASSTARRILPHGVEDASIMLLSDAPALEDFAAGRPIGGMGSGTYAGSGSCSVAGSACGAGSGAWKSGCSSAQLSSFSAFWGASTGWAGNGSGRSAVR